MCFWDTKQMMNYFSLLLSHYPNYANSLSLWNVFKKLLNIPAEPLQWIKHEGSGVLYYGSLNNLIIKLVSLQCYLCLAYNNQAYNNHF